MGGSVMTTYRERAEKAEARIGLAQACIFAMATECTVTARKYSQPGSPRFDQALHEMERAAADAYIGALWFLSERQDDATRVEIRTRVEKSADEQMAAGGARS